ncbi:Plug domain-containing protein [Sphingobacterium sp. KU25419]|nr:Plug domain-containing protein [Sphingobacterium sp. KU25419]
MVNHRSRHIYASIIGQYLGRGGCGGEEKIIQIDGGTLIYNVESTIGGQDVSVLEALKRAPGVYVENESDITLHGKSGVQILLDGRQTFLSGKELTDLLKSLSSNNLKSIEIIIAQRLNTTLSD